MQSLLVLKITIQIPKKKIFKSHHNSSILFRIPESLKTFRSRKAFHHGDLNEFSKHSTAVRVEETTKCDISLTSSCEKEHISDGFDKSLKHSTAVGV